MARAAVSGGLRARRAWRLGVLVDRWAETSTAYTLVFKVTDWPGHLAGQHVDVRLTAEDGYQASRSYSLAAPADGDHIEITVQRLDDGEVSPFLADELAADDELEVRGPLGGWFVWRTEDPGPVQLVGGGSGVIPLVAMVRARAGVSRAPFRLLASVRTPEDRIYAAELSRRAAEGTGLEVVWVYTRAGLGDDSRKPGRLGADDLAAHGWPANIQPTCYVCRPTSFVEAAAGLLLAAGHDAARIRTERFGGS
jgi:ferredoxin-NADP reductase